MGQQGRFESTLRARREERAIHSSRVRAKRLHVSVRLGRVNRLGPRGLLLIKIYKYVRRGRNRFDCIAGTVDGQIVFGGYLMVIRHAGGRWRDLYVIESAGFPCGRTPV